MPLIMHLCPGLGPGCHHQSLVVEHAYGAGHFFDDQTMYNLMATYLGFLYSNEPCLLFFLSQLWQNQSLTMRRLHQEQQ